jgi:ribosomal RNA-processing protein 9
MAANWISAVAAMPYSDLIASGSCDGMVRLWRCGRENTTIEEVRQIPVTGFVNSLCFANSGKFLLVGVGQEHRLGRWQRMAAARNGVLVVPLTDSEL